MNNQILQDNNSSALIEAIEENWAGYIRTFGRASQVEIFDGPEMLWFITGIPEAGFNAVHYTRLQSEGKEKTEAVVKWVLSYFKLREIKPGWLVGPRTRPAFLPVLLKACGLQEVTTISGMALDLVTLKEKFPELKGLSIEPVQDEATLQEWIEAEARGFGISPEAVPFSMALRKGIGFEPGLPPLRHFLARLDGQPLGTVSLFLDGGVAGIYDVSTVPEARHQGIGTLLTLAALKEARKAGYRFAILQTTGGGKSLYQKLGFQDYCTFRAYA